MSNPKNRTRKFILLNAVVSAIFLMYLHHLTRVGQKQDRKIENTGCGNVSSGDNVVEMRYATSTKEYSFLVSLHPFSQDGVVSKGIGEGLFGPKYKYPSIDEMHSVCQTTAHCTTGRAFVEVGSALGMVSIYMASRGMTVYAYDPLLPNIERLLESRCLNGERWCARDNNCSGTLLSTFHVFWNAVGTSDGPRTVRIESEPNNLAATMRGGGSVKADVRVVTIDETVDEDIIEIILLTCQGSEYSALLGASNLLLSRKIHNIVWRVHPTHVVSATKIAGLLQMHGYWFYRLEEARLFGGDPVAISSYEDLLEYIATAHSSGGHPNILATLRRNNSDVPLRFPLGKV